MRRPTFVQIRAAALFAGGMAGATYVTLADQTDRPTLLILFGAMMGLPLFLQVDDKRRAGNTEDPAPTSPPVVPPSTPPPNPTVPPPEVSNAS
jgi:hypothetical protein